MSFLGTDTKVKSASLVDKNQEQMLNMITQGIQGKGPLAQLFGGFNEGTFQQQFKEGVTNPALKDFQENVLPMLQEKFISGNQVGGSGQKQGFNKAGVDLQSKLAELMYGARNTEKNQLNQNAIAGLGIGVNKQTKENVVIPGQEGWGVGLAKAGIGAAGQIFKAGA